MSKLIGGIADWMFHPPPPVTGAKVEVHGCSGCSNCRCESPADTRLEQAEAAIATLHGEQAELWKAIATICEHINEDED